MHDAASKTPPERVVPAPRLREQIALILSAWNMPPEAVATVADVMVDTDLRGIDSHGISMLMIYDEMQRKGRLRVNAQPRIVRENLVTASIDAGAGLGHPPSVMAMHLAVDKALVAGVAVVSVHNSHHFGAAGYYARIAAQRGAVGMVTTGTRIVSTVPTRGSAPVMGTNPIAFAAPAKSHAPFVLDMSTSTVANNKVRLYGLRDKPLPPGWVIDETGAPMTDAVRAYEQITKRDAGGLTPVGGTPESGSHKGYGLSVLVQILGSTLGGGSFSPLRLRTQRDEDPDNIGHFFLAIDPKAFRDEGDFERDLDDVIDVLHATPPIDSAQSVLVAGEPEEIALAYRSVHGVPIAPALAAKLRDLCARTNVAYVLD